MKTASPGWPCQAGPARLLSTWGAHGGHRPPCRAGLLLCLVAAGLAAAGALAGCGGIAGPASVRSTLFAALEMLDSARSLHISYTTNGRAPPGDTVATGGEGDLERPASFAGAFQVSEGGLPISVSLVVVDGVAYLRLPFSQYRRVDLRKYGFTNPVALFDPKTGLTAAFRRTGSLSYGGSVAEKGVTLWSINGYAPGELVSGALQITPFQSSVKVGYDIDPKSGRLMTISMTGPFYSRGQQSGITITLSDYGEALAIRPPQ